MKCSDSIIPLAALGIAGYTAYSFVGGLIDVGTSVWHAVDPAFQKQEQLAEKRSKAKAKALAVWKGLKGFEHMRDKAAQEFSKKKHNLQQLPIVLEKTEGTEDEPPRWVVKQPITERFLNGVKPMPIGHTEQVKVIYECHDIIDISVDPSTAKPGIVYVSDTPIEIGKELCTDTVTLSYK